jgi:Ala-tRNA(Pro) deacylase
MTLNSKKLPIQLESQRSHLRHFVGRRLPVMESPSASKRQVAGMYMAEFCAKVSVVSLAALFATWQIMMERFDFCPEEKEMQTEEFETYAHLMTWLDSQSIPFRLMEHAPEGRTELVSQMRGNSLSAAAKCIVLLVKIGKKITRYVLVVVPGDRKVDLQAVKALLGGTYVAFASPEIAERLAGSVIGTILPFSFTEELELIADPSLLSQDELYFNAARLDRSLVLKTSDWLTLAKPRLERIVEQ